MPNKWGGDHDLKVGVSYMYSSLRTQDFGNLNGTFTIPSDLPFNAADPRTYPERLSIRVGNPLDFYMKGHFIGGFVQDKWRPSNRLTVSVGARYDLELLRTPNQDNPLYPVGSGDYPIDANNFAPRLGFTYAMDDESRSAIRGGFGVFYQRTSFTFLTPMFSGGRYSDSFIVEFPVEQRRSRDRGPATSRPHPALRNGPTVNHAPIDAQFPPGTLNRNVGTVRFDNPDRQNSWSRQYSMGYERQIGATLGVGIDFIRSEQRGQFVLIDLNPGIRDTTLATSTLRRNTPLVGDLGEFAARVENIVNDGEVDYNTVQVVDDAAAVRRIQRAAVVRLLARRGQCGHRPGRRRRFAAARRPQPGSGRRADQRRPAAHLVGWRPPTRCRRRRG